MNYEQTNIQTNEQKQGAEHRNIIKQNTIRCRSKVQSTEILLKNRKKEQSKEGTSEQANKRTNEQSKYKQANTSTPLGASQMNK